MSFEDLTITKDGLTYVIEVMPWSGRGTAFLLREDPDGWYVKEASADRHYRIGRRKRWTKALADALDWIEAELSENQSSLNREVKCEPTD